MPESNFQRKTRREHQSRLVFDPVAPGSQSPMSPARLRYSTPNGKKKVQDKTTTLDDADSSKYTSADESATVMQSSRKKKELKALLSPQKSSQLSAKGLGTAGRLHLLL